MGVQTPGRVLTYTGRPLDRRPSFWLSHVPYWAGPCLLSVTITTMALDLRSPRPHRRRLTRRPGMAAGLAVALALAVVATQCLEYLIATGEPLNELKARWQPYLGYFWTTFPTLAGYTVAVSWLALVLSGCWSSEPGSRARLGRALGWSWIAMTASSELGVWCYALNY
jgi:hypothetical protein